MSDINDLIEILYSPITEEEIIGFYKIANSLEPRADHLKNIIDISARYNYLPQQIFLNMMDLPEIAKSLNIDVIREYSTPIPLKMNFGSVVFGFVWDNYISSTVRRLGAWEPEVQEQIVTCLRPGDTALDIGGNIGCHAALMASIVGPTGRVHTFEPVARNVELLRKMKGVNSFENLEIHPVAVSDKEDRLSINVHATNSGGNSIASHSNSSHVEYIRAVDLDTYMLPKLDRLDFVKIDIEGHEGPAIKGAAKTLARFKPNLIMELCPDALRRNGTDPVALVQILFDAGLDVTIIGAEDHFAAAQDVVTYIEARAPYRDILAKRPQP